MKPRNKFQKRVVELNEQLPKITKQHIEWGQQKCFDAFYVVSRSRYFCLECGHKFELNTAPYSDHRIKQCTCPSCHKKLKKIDRKDTVHSSIGYMAILTTVEEFQVIRIVHITKNMKKKEAPIYYSSEVIQNWFNASGKTATFARSGTMGAGYYRDVWAFHSDLSLKDAFDLDRRYTVYTEDVYPERQILPEIKRNGFKGHFYGAAPYRILYKLLNDPYSETLIKSKQTPILRDHLNNGGMRSTKYWPSIKICIRNQYIVKDPGIWYDYLELLEFFGKDLHNAKYVCPDDLKSAHDKFVNKKLLIERRQELEEQRETIEQSQTYYERNKRRFFGIQFQDRDLTVKVIEHVQDFLVEGDILGHCLFASKYYKRKDSLILSARVKGEVVETVEVSLSRMEILQARGKSNKASKYNTRIVELVNKNMNKISQAHNTRKNKQTNLAKSVQELIQAPR